MKIKLISLIILVFLIILFSEQLSQKETIDFNQQNIKITICGELENPGIYEIELGTTFQELLEIIKLKESADLSSFNPLTIIKANDYLVIPKQGHDLISINYGTYQQLLTVKGIGPVLANKIIEYRSNYGLFQRLEDLKLIKGIKEKIFIKIKDYLCL